MKWSNRRKHVSYRINQIHSTRTIKKFLWFPKLIDEQWRWLMIGRWVEQCFPINRIFTNSPRARAQRLPDHMVFWAPQQWEDKPPVSKQLRRYQ